MNRAKIIFTYRPLSIRKPMSIINAITRLIQGYPRDHVVIYYNESVFESTYGVGVQEIPYKDWVVDRIGTDTVEYLVPVDILDFQLFTKLDPAKYDTRAAIFHLFGLEERLERRANQAINCSELLAVMLGMPKAWKALPKDVEHFLRSEKYPSRNKTL